MRFVRWAMVAWALFGVSTGARAQVPGWRWNPLVNVDALAAGMQQRAEVLTGSDFLTLETTRWLALQIGNFQSTLAIDAQPYPTLSQHVPFIAGIIARLQSDASNAWSFAVQIDATDLVNELQSFRLDLRTIPPGATTPEDSIAQ